MVLESRRDSALAVFFSLCVGFAGCVGMGDEPPPSALNYVQPNAYNNRLATTSGYGGMSANQMAALGGPVSDGSARPVVRFQGPQGEIISEPGALGMPGMVDGGVMGPMGPMGPPIPTEIAKSTHPPHRVAAPDTLLIQALRMIPRGPYRLNPLEVVALEVTNTLPHEDIKGAFTIAPEGTINLGFNYGTVPIAGLTIDQAQMAIRKHLGNILKNPTVNIALMQMQAMQMINGEHLVRPDGTISLGVYGSVYVAGMNLGQVKCVIEQHLSPYLLNPQISVDVLAYNSRKIYVIADGAGYGQQVIVLPCTGNETVLDAISRVGGLPPMSSQKKIWVARPSPAGHPCSQILPVDWKAIVQAGRTETNYQLFPGDRLYISGDPLVTVYNYMDKMLAPVERILGVTLLGTFVYRSIAGTNSGLLIR